MTHESNEHNESFEFGFFDPRADTQVYERNLPHWFQAGAALYITFRLLDSLPELVMERIVGELEAWLLRRKLPTEFAKGAFSHDQSLRFAMERRLEKHERIEFRALTGQLVHRSLDECHGSCLLRDPRCAEIVADCMLKFDGIKYDMDLLVVMPNHVHAIAQFHDPAYRRAVGQSWMRYSARQINQLLGREGSLWQQEPFDHIIRSPEQFHYIQDYIRANPQKAKLNPSEYLYWMRK